MAPIPHYGTFTMIVGGGGGYRLCDDEHPNFIHCGEFRVFIAEVN